MTAQPCGTTQFGEEGYCAFHLAELTNQTLNEVNYARANGQLEFQRATHLTCGKRKRGRCLVPMGVVLQIGAQP